MTLVVSWKSRVRPGKRISRRAVRLERPNGSWCAWFSILNGTFSPYSGKNASSPPVSRSSGRSHAGGSPRRRTFLRPRRTALIRAQGEVLLQFGLQAGELRAQGLLVDRDVHGGPPAACGGRGLPPVSQSTGSFEPDVHVGQPGRQLVRFSVHHFHSITAQFGGQGGALQEGTLRRQPPGTRRWRHCVPGALFPAAGHGRPPPPRRAGWPAVRRPGAGLPPVPRHRATVSRTTRERCAETARTCAGTAGPVHLDQLGIQRGHGLHQPCPGGFPARRMQRVHGSAGRTRRSPPGRHPVRPGHPAAAPPPSRCPAVSRRRSLRRTSGRCQGPSPRAGPVRAPGADHHGGAPGRGAPVDGAHVVTPHVIAQGVELGAGAADLDRGLAVEFAQLPAASRAGAAGNGTAAGPAVSPDTRWCAGGRPGRSGPKERMVTCAVVRSPRRTGRSRTACTPAFARGHVDVAGPGSWRPGRGLPTVPAEPRSTPAAVVADREYGFGRFVERQRSPVPAATTLTRRNDPANSRSVHNNARQHSNCGQNASTSPGPAAPGQGQEEPGHQAPRNGHQRGTGTDARMLPKHVVHPHPVHLGFRLQRHPVAQAGECQRLDVIGGDEGTAGEPRPGP